MIKKLNTVKLFVNQNVKAKRIAKIVEKAMKKAGFLIVDEQYDLAIAIGGDGSFLRMVRNNNFDSNIYYLGINAGTLGFLQEGKLDCIEELVSSLKNGDFHFSEIGVQETVVQCGKNSHFFYSLNEIVIRDKCLNTTYFDVLIDQQLLEHYVGDGMLVATSIGSTAYNLSFGGSVVFDDFHTLQLTPIAPLNSKVNRTLRNSVIIPENRVITFLPKKDHESLLVAVDGENHSFEHVDSIITVVEKKTIRCVRFSETYVEKINEKFLS